MLGYLTIFVASLCGYAGAPLWTPLLAAAGLFSVSLAQHQGLIKRGLARGFQADIEEALWRSALSAVGTTSGMFLFGIVVRALSH